MTYQATCERCRRPLTGSDPACVCSYESTFCVECSRGLGWRCPNCQGELARRPRRGSSDEVSEAFPRRTRELGDRVRVERASLEDLDALVRLFEGYRKFYRQAADRPGARRFLKERIVRRDSVIFLARSGKRVVGFAQLYPTFASTRLGPLWNLNDLFVRPADRHKGVASRLLQRCQELAEETGALGVWLETAVDNPAQRLYAAHGWKLDREFLHFDWDRADHRVPRGVRGHRRRAERTPRRKTR